MLLGYAGRKLDRQEPSETLIWPPVLEMIKTLFFTNILIARGRPRRISLLYSLRWGTSPPRRRKRLKFSMPSSLLSLTVRPAILGVLSPLSWKPGPGSRINAPRFPVPSLLLSVSDCCTCAGRAVTMSNPRRARQCIYVWTLQKLCARYSLVVFSFRL